MDQKHYLDQLKVCSLSLRREGDLAEASAPITKRKMPFALFALKTRSVSFHKDRSGDLLGGIDDTQNVG
jgi:hypothetical protein